jgi:Ca2+/Na+ antiporter
LVVLEFVGALAAILAAAYLFTNAVEMLGGRLDLGQGAVGSVLAAVGTALPETMIPIVAILGAALAGGDSGVAGEIGIGAILGAPFLLATLAMFVAGTSALGYRRRRESVTGAMVFQSSVPVALGLAFTSWSLSFLHILAVALGLAGGAYLYLLLRREKPIQGGHLLVGGALYAAFVIAAIFGML